MKRLLYLSITCFIALCLNFCINERRGRAAATPVSVTGTTPYLATDDAEAFEGDSDDNTVSYEDAEEGVTVDLETPENNVGDFAEGDTFDNIESLIGSDFDDTLTGDSGDNTLEGGEGADTLDGGAGADTASYEASSSAVMIDLSQSPISATGGDAEGDTLSNIENLIGSTGDDTLTGDSGDNTLNGGAGADTLTGGAGADTLVGGAGADIYIFSEGDGTDSITDESGDMTLQFVGTSYAFLVAGNFARSGDNLVITEMFTLSDNSVVTNMITITGAYDKTGQPDNTAFPISISINGLVQNDIWSGMDPP